MTKMMTNKSVSKDLQSYCEETNKTSLIPIHVTESIKNRLNKIAYFALNTHNLLNKSIVNYFNFSNIPVDLSTIANSVMGDKQSNSVTLSSNIQKCMSATDPSRESLTNGTKLLGNMDSGSLQLLMNTRDSVSATTPQKKHCSQDDMKITFLTSASKDLDYDHFHENRNRSFAFASADRGTNLNSKAKPDPQNVTNGSESHWKDQQKYNIRYDHTVTKNYRQDFQKNNDADYEPTTPAKHLHEIKNYHTDTSGNIRKKNYNDVDHKSATTKHHIHELLNHSICKLGAVGSGNNLITNSLGITTISFGNNSTNNSSNIFGNSSNINRNNNVNNSSNNYINRHVGNNMSSSNSGMTRGTDTSMNSIKSGSSGRPASSRHPAHRSTLPKDWWTIAAYLVALILLYSGCAVCDVRFSGGIRNETVTLGRDASLECTVEGLGNHKVGWIHLKRQMIVAVHTRMITRISRYSVTHEDDKTWTLHINGVREEDRGYYMCQVNTKPALSQVGYLRVVVPPTIVDEDSSDSEIQVREKKNVTLRCSGRGRPDPRLMWRREDGTMIVPDDRNPVRQVDGEVLQLASVSRTHMGSYLCIASNGVPPSVSKRITLKVEFPPQIHVPNQLVGVPTGDNVTIDCHVEAFPQAISYWVRDKVMVMDDAKYKTEIIESVYKIDMRLTVFNFSSDDSRTYKCVAKNSLGETEGDIRLNEIYTPPKIKEIRSNGQTDEEMSPSNHLGAKTAEDSVGRSSVHSVGGRRPPVSEVEVIRAHNIPDPIRDVSFYEDPAVPQSSFPHQADFSFTSGAATLNLDFTLRLSLPQIHDVGEDLQDIKEGIITTGSTRFAASTISTEIAAPELDNCGQKLSATHSSNTTTTNVFSLIQIICHALGKLYWRNLVFFVQPLLITILVNKWNS